MFLAAVGRPHTRQNGTFFNDFVGILPFIEKSIAQRSSKNGERGTIELKAINVTGEAWHDMMIQRVLPTIHKKFWHAERYIVLQIDGARAHFKASIQSNIEQALHVDEFSMTIDKQPPNSPNLNVLDLGYLHSLQVAATTVKEGADLSTIVKIAPKAF